MSASEGYKIKERTLKVKNQGAYMVYLAFGNTVYSVQRIIVSSKTSTLPGHLRERLSEVLCRLDKGAC